MTTRLWIRPLLAVGVFALASFAVWWFVGVDADLIARAAYLGAVAGLAAVLVGVGKPAVKAFLYGRPLSVRPYLVPREPPPPPTHFVGRDAELTKLIGHLRNARRDPRVRLRWPARPFVLVIHGEPGVGKSGLANKVAAMVAADFPHGVLYVSMKDAVPGSARLTNVLGDLVDSLQGPGDQVPRGLRGRRRLLRRLSRTRPRVLYVLDDVVSSQAVKEVLPRSRRAAVLITTRSTGLGLPGRVVERRLAPLSAEDSETLLRRLLSVPTKDPSRPEDQTDRAIRRIAVAAAGYPLALHLAIRAVASQGLWALPGLTDDLPDHAGSRSEKVAGELMLRLSLKVLTPVQRQVLMSLPRMPYPTFVPWMVHALAGLPTDKSEDDVWLICDRLADQRLLERTAPDASGVVRLRVPDRVQAYLEALEGRLTEEERSQNIERLEDVRKHREPPTVHDILAMLDHGRVGLAVDEARSALSDAIINDDLAAAKAAAERRRKAGAKDPTISADPLGPTRVLTAQGRAALAVLAEVLAELGGLDDAMEMATAQDRARAERRRKQDRRPPDDAAEVRLRRSLGRLLRRAGRDREAEKTQTRALALARAPRINDLEQEILTLRELAIVRSKLGRHNHGIDQANETLAEAWRILQGGRASLIDESREPYLRCRLVEAEAMVLLNGKGDNRPTDEKLRRALQRLAGERRTLPPELRLWHAWLTYQEARVIAQRAKVAEDQRISGEWPDDGEFLSPPEYTRRLRLQARLRAEAALGAFATMNHRYGTARCRLEIGRSYEAEGSVEAIGPLEEARETFFFCGDRAVEAETALLLARARIHSGQDLDAADAELVFATRVLRGVGNRDLLRLARDTRRELDKRRSEPPSTRSAAARNAGPTRRPVAVGGRR